MPRAWKSRIRASGRPRKPSWPTSAMRSSPTPASDFLSILKLWDFYHHLKEDALATTSFAKPAARISCPYNRLREWADIYRQLRQIVEESGRKRYTHAATTTTPSIERC